MAEIQMARYEDFASASKTVFVDIDHPAQRGKKVRIEAQSLAPGDLYSIAGAALTRLMQQDAVGKDAKDPNDAAARTAYLQSLDESAVTELYGEDTSIKAMQRLVCKMVLPPLRLSTLPQSECPPGVVSVNKISTEDQWAIYNACYDISVVSAEDRFPSDSEASEDAGGSSGTGEPAADGKRKRESAE